MSAAGGAYRAVEIAHRCGCDCVQLFSKNNNQWRAKPLTDDDVHRFRDALARLGIAHPIIHDSYLINLASPDQALRQKSIDAFIVELERAERLGIGYVVTHPGSFTTCCEEQGLARVAQALDEVHCRLPEARVRTLLENTAGQGTNLGWRFEHLAAILASVREPERLGVCFDTCHAFAAGYAMQTRKEYLATMREFDRIVGLERIQAFHLNDSLREQGSRVDRHARIGAGRMGLEPFRHLLNDRRFRNIPMYLETPKGKQDGVDLDVINLATLRRLVAR
jgi:deoxyribonuclease-4